LMRMFYKRMLELTLAAAWADCCFIGTIAKLQQKKKLEEIAYQQPKLPQFLWDYWGEADFLDHLCRDVVTLEISLTN